MGILSNQTKNVLRDAFKRHAKINDCEANTLQVIIGIKKEGEVTFPVYSVSKNFDYNNRQFFDFENLTGIGLDGSWAMFPYKDICDEHLPKYLTRVAKEKKLDAEKTEVFVITNNAKMEKLGLYLYENKQPIKPIDFDYLFGEDEDKL